MAADSSSSTDLRDPEPEFEAYLSPTADFLLVLGLATALALLTVALLVP